ncbi:arylamine N-acetyltransferase family protein [Kitasatospora sp. NPDC004240]
MAIDLKRYLARLGRDGESPATLETLRGLHRAHVLAVPFENLDPLLGRAPSLDADDLQAKLVDGGRGGYCFEQNTLLADVLEELGFGVTRLAGRVRLGAKPGDVRPRTHMMLAVTVPGEPGTHLADVGFGAVGALLEPLPMLPEAEREGAGRRHRLVVEPADDGGRLDTWVLQTLKADGWEDQYGFTLEPFTAQDYEVANWFVATYPRSPFRTGLFVQRTAADGGHLNLAGRRLTETAADGTVRERELASADDVRALLEGEFGIAVPDGLAGLTL